MNSYQNKLDQIAAKRLSRITKQKVNLNNSQEIEDFLQGMTMTGKAAPQVADGRLLQSQIQSAIEELEGKNDSLEEVE